MGAESFLTLQIVDFAEGVDDRVAALLTAGTGITLTYNDGAGTLTIANTGLGGSTGSTDNRILRADGTSGATVQNSAVTIDDSGNISGLGTISCGDRITLGSDTYIERPSSGLINIFQAGAVRAAISSGEITATSAIRLTAFNPAAPDIAFVRNSTGPTAETRAAGGLRVRNADGSAAGAINCGAITASGALNVNNASGIYESGSGRTVAFTSNFSASTPGIGTTTNHAFCIYTNGANERLRFAATGAITANSTVAVGVFTVATLPSAAANAGAMAQVTDSSVTTNGSAVSGGGANRVVVFSNGSTWDVVVA